MIQESSNKHTFIKKTLLNKILDKNINVNIWDVCLYKN